MTDVVLEARVDQGIAWLDEHVPDWRKRIDVDELDMSYGNGCILGQVFRREDASGYLSGLKAAGARPEELRAGNAWAVAHGFDADFSFSAPDVSDIYAELDEIWKARLAAEVPA